jgi:hypothetical protein
LDFIQQVETFGFELRGCNRHVTSLHDQSFFSSEGRVPCLTEPSRKNAGSHLYRPAAAACRLASSVG